MQRIEDVTIPQDLSDTVEVSIDRALAQRPDLMAQVEQLRAAGSEIKAAKTAYLPTLSFSGIGGLSRTDGQQALMPRVYSPNQETWGADGAATTESGGRAADRGDRILQRRLAVV